MIFKYLHGHLVLNLFYLRKKLNIKDFNSSITAFNRISWLSIELISTHIKIWIPTSQNGNKHKWMESYFKLWSPLPHIFGQNYTPSQWSYKQNPKFGGSYSKNRTKQSKNTWDCWKSMNPKFRSHLMLRKWKKVPQEIKNSLLQKFSL